MYRPAGIGPGSTRKVVGESRSPRPNASSQRSVWSRKPAGLVMDDTPSAWRAARMKADRTWAEAISISTSAPARGAVPPTATGGVPAVVSSMLAPRARSGVTSLRMGLFER